MNYKTYTTRKTSSCGGPIAAGAKTAATGRLLRRVLGLPLYMKSIAAGYSGGPTTRRNIPVSAAQA